MHPDDNRLDKWSSSTFDHLFDGAGKAIRQKEHAIIGGMGRWLYLAAFGWAHGQGYEFSADVGEIHAVGRKRFFVLEGANGRLEILYRGGERPDAGDRAVVAFVKVVRRRGHPIKEKKLRRMHPSLLGYYQSDSDGPVHATSMWSQLVGRPGFYFLSGSILSFPAMIFHPAAPAAWFIVATPAFLIKAWQASRDKRMFADYVEKVIGGEDVNSNLRFAERRPYNYLYEIK